MGQSIGLRRLSQRPLILDSPRGCLCVSLSLALVCVYMHVYTQRGMLVEARVHNYLTSLSPTNTHIAIREHGDLQDVVVTEIKNKYPVKQGSHLIVI